VDGKIIISSANNFTLEFPNFYCNWMAIGNVVTTIKLSIDSIDLNKQSFAGFYSMAFYGTGNANGSGYYKAVMAPPAQEMMLEQEMMPEQKVTQLQ
jgi:hypothetical protein